VNHNDHLMDCCVFCDTHWPHSNTCRDCCLLMGTYQHWLHLHIRQSNCSALLHSVQLPPLPSTQRQQVPPELNYISKGLHCTMFTKTQHLRP